MAIIVVVLDELITTSEQSYLEVKKLDAFIHTLVGLSSIMETNFNE